MLRVMREPSCSIYGGSLKYRDRVPRIMKRYNGDVSYVMIERSIVSDTSPPTDSLRRLCSFLYSMDRFHTIIEKNTPSIYEANCLTLTLAFLENSPAITNRSV